MLTDPALEAQLYFKRYAAYPPDPFIDTTAKRRRKVCEDLEDGEGWAARLWGTLNEPHAYSLHAEHLGLPPRCADPTNFYCRENVALWKAAIDAAFTKPLHWKLELGERVHVHLIADREAGLPHLPRGGELVKSIYDLEGWLFYLAKPNAPWNERNMALWLQATRLGCFPQLKRRLPHLSGTMGIQNRKNWHRGALSSSQ